MKARLLIAVWPGILLVLAIWVFDLPQRLYNRIDYPVGVKLRLKRIEPQPALPDTVRVDGYWQDEVSATVTSDFRSRHVTFSNQDLHNHYLPFK